jgi:hypothetical protein
MEPDNPLNNASAPSGGLPDPSGMKLKKPKKNKTIIYIVGGFVGLIVLLLVVLIVVNIRNTNIKQTALKAQYDKGYDTGKKEQKTASDAEIIDRDSKNVRVYKAPNELGSFQVPIPKTWSWVITPNLDSGLFVGLSDPDYVDTTSKLHKLKVELASDSYADKVKSFDEVAKRSGGKLVATDTTVSGIKGRRYKGVVDTQTKQEGEIVMVPYREKVLIFRTDDPANYSQAFNNILAGTKLAP